MSRLLLATTTFVFAACVVAGCGNNTTSVPGPQPAGSGVAVPTAAASSVASNVPTGAPGSLPTAAPTSTAIAALGQWVSAWADAPTDSGPGPVDEMTVREIVKPTVGSRGTVRLHFSNFFGETAVSLGAVHVGIQTTGAGVSGDLPVSFSGKASVSIPAAGFVTSDPLPFSFSYGQILAVTEYIQGVNPILTFHEQGFGKVTSYQTAANAGDKTADTAGTSFTGTTMNTYLLDRLDVYGDYKETVVAFGSSTTDGYEDNGLGIDQHKSWPEQLAELLHSAGHDDIAVANAGIAGNTVTGPAGVDPPAPAPNPETGEPGVQRFSRDVLAIPGVKVIIDYLGANDLRVLCDPQASEVIPDKHSFVTQAHAMGIRVLVATTAPSAYCNEEEVGGQRFPQGFGEEAERFALVAWEKATAPVTVDGTLEQPDGADGVIDFDAAIRDPANLSYMLPQYDSGDEVHPNNAGYAAMASAIPLSSL